MRKQCPNSWITGIPQQCHPFNIATFLFVCCFFFLGSSMEKRKKEKSDTLSFPKALFVFAFVFVFFPRVIKATSLFYFPPPCYRFCHPLYPRISLFTLLFHFHTSPLPMALAVTSEEPRVCPWSQLLEQRAPVLQEGDLPAVLGLIEKSVNNINMTRFVLCIPTRTFWDLNPWW